MKAKKRDHFFLIFGTVWSTSIIFKSQSVFPSLSYTSEKGLKCWCGYRLLQERHRIVKFEDFYL